MGFKMNLESIILNTFFSVVFTLVLFVFSGSVIWYLWEININSGFTGAITFLFDFIFLFVAMSFLFDYESNDN